MLYHGHSLSSSYPTIKMLSAMPNTFGRSLSILPIFCQNMSPTGAVLNGNLAYHYVSTLQANVVRYEEFLSNIRL